jgi:transcriptional regulator with XRE-family HTH domain
VIGAFAKFTKLRELRETAGWTQDELALRSGLSQTYISDLENGKARVNHMEQLKKLANAFGMTVDSIRDYLE